MSALPELQNGRICAASNGSAAVPTGAIKNAGLYRLYCPVMAHTCPSRLKSYQELNIVSLNELNCELTFSLRVCCSLLEGSGSLLLEAGRGVADGPILLKTIYILILARTTFGSTQIHT